MLKFDGRGRFVFPTDTGFVGLAWTPKGIRRLILGLDQESTQAELAADCGDLPQVKRVSGEMATLVKRIKAHLKGKNDDFGDVPVDLQLMADFSRQILRRLRKVPPGSVTTYGELAKLCGKPGAARAVGRIMGANPVPLIVPCHRCLGKDGSMTGFSTQGGIAIKARMLYREGYVANERYAEGMQHLQKVDKVMARIIKAVGPYRAMPDQKRPPWDTLVTAITHQQLSVKAGQTIAGRVEKLTPGPGFPNAEEMLGLKHEELRGAGLSNQKVSYLQDLAARVNNGSLNLARLNRLDDEEVITELTKVRGIGRWSAQMHLMFHLDRLDVLPTGDLGVQIAAARFYGLGEYATVKELEEIGRKWAPYRSLGSWYLWQGLDSGGI